MISSAIRMMVVPPVALDGIAPSGLRSAASRGPRAGAGGRADPGGFSCEPRRAAAARKVYRTRARHRSGLRQHSALTTARLRAAVLLRADDGTTPGCGNTPR
jgi:hypothetical protein